MQTLTLNAPVLHENLTHRQKYQRRNLWHRLTLYKWKMHNDRVIASIFDAVGWPDSPPVNFEPLQQYLGGYGTEYLDIRDFPEDLLPHKCTKNEIAEGRHIIGDRTIYFFADERVWHTRRRFTLAHEWGHVFQFFDDEFKIEMEAIPNPSIRQDIIECTANAFASSFLMPSRLIRDAVSGLPMFPVDPDLTAEMIARGFGVSQEAMRYRLMDYIKRLEQ